MLAKILSKMLSVFCRHSARNVRTKDLRKEKVRAETRNAVHEKLLHHVDINAAAAPRSTLARKFYGPTPQLIRRAARYKITNKAAQKNLHVLR